MLDLPRICVFQSLALLTRPEGRMQYGPTGTTGTARLMFQSSPGQKAGCNHAAIRTSGQSAASQRVSILTRPEGRMQCAVIDRVFQSSPGQKAGCVRVSILTRPEGRMQSARSHQLTGVHRCKSFNPHPARRPDAIARIRAGHWHSNWFQSSPGQKAGCNHHVTSR